MVTWFGALMFGWLLGMRHALEPDHLAAVSNIVVHERRPTAGATIGMFWGLGHSASLLAVGLALGFLHSEMPATLGQIFELGVAIMLIVLGARSVLRALGTGAQGPTALHQHRGVFHSHSAYPDHVHVGGVALARRPLLIGLVHGLAGSGALTALAVANMPTFFSRVVFTAVFGLGSVMGMAFLTGLAGWPLSGISRDLRMARGLGIATGAFSLALGAWWGAPIVRALVGSL